MVSGCTYVPGIWVPGCIGHAIGPMANTLGNGNGQQLLLEPYVDADGYAYYLQWYQVVGP